MSGFEFSGKRVLVTGASRGIGYGIARAFAAAGAEVYVLADTPDVHEAAGSLSAQSGRPVTGLQCDISDRARVAESVGTLGPLDVLINNAGLERVTPILEPGAAVEETFRRIIDINVLGTYYVTREAAAAMAPGARIVITASVWGKSAEAEFSAYCASKHANLGFMRALARELGGRGITVNAVCPGWVRTDASLRSAEHMAGRRGGSREALLESIVSVQALPGLMQPEDVAGAYLFLASDAAANITGQALNVDRGELTC
ncbi:MAG: SDR family NAD(P)-dependent oxidoreductase [Gammaproteobacteria bacterium]